MLRRPGLGLLLLVTLSAGLVGGVVVDRQVLAGFVPLASMPHGARPDFALITEAWNAIERSYVDRAAVRPRRMTYGAIRGMVDALGDRGHSGFLDPTMVSQLGEFAHGRLKGIGIEVRSRDGHVVVVAPMDGSPAQRAGLRPGDVIERVDGKPVTGLPLTVVVRRISGPVGTRVTLLIMSAESGETRAVTLTRTEITLRNVRWRMLPGTRLAHLRVAAFTPGVTNDLRVALQQIARAGAAGVVLDLRDNSGGLLDEAIGVASQFLSGGDVLREKDAAGRVTPVPVRPGGVAPHVPLIVLVNRGSASAAEIVAGALQDRGRARLVGETTFGTGTVLRPFPLSDGSAVILAVQEWLTPSGRSYWHEGIEPDVVVPLPSPAEPLFPDGEEQLTAARLQASGDFQLLRAVALMTAASARARRP